MKKILFLLSFIEISLCSSSQIICGDILKETENARTPLYIANGGVFTPKGNIRVLFVFIKYGGIYDTLFVDGWEANADRPQWAMSASPAFYSDYSEFNTNVYGGDNVKCVSDFYYQMSNGLFRMTADYYSATITLDPSQSNSRGEFHQQVLQQIPNTFDWSRYDNRSDRPYYTTDNSNTVPDGIVDYIIFCHRFNRNWSTIPNGWLQNVSYDGIAIISNTGTEEYLIPSTNYSVKNGFSYLSGGMEPIYLFPHELGHELYYGSHYNGANGAIGNYFYVPSSGWGMMNIMRNYTCALGWERYILDWTPQITASDIPSDIDNASDLVTTNGFFTLRDFITTGDAIRIKLPTIDGSHQYLWLENHQGVSTFDDNICGEAFCGDSIEKYKKGLVAYVEEYSHVKQESNVYSISKDNAIRWLSKNGNIDFSYINTPLYPAPLCNWEGHNVNKTYHFFKGKGNPLGGYCVNEFIRYDYNGNNTIENSEKVFAVQIDDEEPTARWMTGSGMQFHEGDKVGMATNPTVRNMPKYDSNNKKMGDYYLNGISFEVLGRSVGNTMRVKVRLDDVAVDRDVRWAAASIVLGDITGDNRPDVDVQPNIKLTIDMSGTPNRHANPDNPNHTSSVLEDFITPTRFACRNGAFFKQEPYSVVEVKNGSTLVLENGSVYEVGDHASLTIEPSATLVVKSGATLRVLGSGHVEVADLAYICVEDGAYIDLVDTVSAVNLMPLAVQGTYSYGNVPQCTCTLTDITEYPLAHGSNGGIYQCNTDRIISSTTYTHDAYECGLNIRAGRISDGMTRPRDVVIDNGTRVVMDAAQSVSLEPGFKVNAGGRLEIR